MRSKKKALGGCVVVSVLLTTGCATESIFGDKGITSAAGEGPGYYAGLEEGVYSISRADWKRWFDGNRAGIVDIQSKIAKIKTGQLNAGCIGQDVHTCVATLAQTLAMADDYLVSSLYKPDTVDVNGNVLFERAIFVSGFLPGKRTLTNTENKLRFDIRLGNDRRISDLTVSLPKDPFFAHTQEEYDATGFYEVISALGRTDCPGLTPNQAARFIENEVKPRAHLSGEEASCSASSGCTSANNNQTKEIEFCGQTMEFDSVYGNASDLASESNLHGAFGGMSVIFKTGS